MSKYYEEILKGARGYLVANNPEKVTDTSHTDKFQSILGDDERDDMEEPSALGSSNVTAPCSVFFNLSTCFRLR